MKTLVQLAVKIAKVDSTVLIQGESGVGKEVISKLIHKSSPRERGPFIKIDCGAIPENLLESELFGYEKGAFTGALHEGKVGMIELAHNGTLFLDEISELPLHLQVKLLRVLQDREIIRIGGKEPIKIDTRIIAASNRNLSSLVEENLFRKDLFYRLNVIPIDIPPLRERQDDIEPLVRFFMVEICKKYKLEKRISPAVLRTLIDYSWPGNVRELKNVVERMVVTSTGMLIGPEDVPQSICESQRSLSASMNESRLHELPLKQILDEYEKQVLEALMKKAKNLNELSTRLQIDRGTVRRKFQKYRICKDFNNP